MSKRNECGFVMKKQYFLAISLFMVFLFFSNCSKNSVSCGCVLVERGYVYSANNNTPLDSVVVRITGIYKNSLPVEGNAPVLTDSNGYFEIGVGSDENLFRDTVIFSKQGYIDTSFEVYPRSINNSGNSNGYDTIRMRSE